MHNHFAKLFTCLTGTSDCPYLIWKAYTVARSAYWFFFPTKHLYPKQHSLYMQQLTPGVCCFAANTQSPTEMLYNRKADIFTAIIAYASITKHLRPAPSHGTHS